MREIKLLTNEMIKSGALEEAQFVFYTSDEAMGEGGVMRIVQKDGEVYSGNYIYGGLDMNLIIKRFPYVGADGFDDVFNTGKSEDGEIYYYYLECGNHLFVRKDVNDAFSEAVKDCHYCDEVVGKWFDKACIICPDQHRKEMIKEVKWYCKELEMSLPDRFPNEMTDDQLSEWIAVWDEFDPCSDLN